MTSVDGERHDHSGTRQWWCSSSSVPRSADDVPPTSARQLFLSIPLFHPESPTSPCDPPASYPFMHITHLRLLSSLTSPPSFIHVDNRSVTRSFILNHR